MSSAFALIPILLPMAGAIVLAMMKNANEKTQRAFIMTFTVLTSILTWVIVLYSSYGMTTLIWFSERFRFAIKIDGLGRFFAALAATLWPLTTLYAFEYMEEEERVRAFFCFFLVSYSATLGVAMAGSLFTLYCFYELLTLSTLPLVAHTRTHAANQAGRFYLAISIGGSSFALLSIIYLVITPTLTPNVWTQIFFLFGFFGFGVKAAIFPTHVWLPKASVAPTPVTALLHAVAVVKSGVFAIIRLTWYGYGTDLISGTASQYIALGFAAFTIVFASSKAVKERHFKRRLAYSTVANLSYILFGVMLLTTEGLTAGLLHMAFHAEIKILTFFAAGAVLVHSKKEYIYELDGIGRSMPFTFIFFTIGALALTGIPPFSGFVSKWALLTAGADAGTWIAYIGTGCIIISALLTAIYMFSVVRRAFFPDKGSDLSRLSDTKEAGKLMLIPMGIIACGILVTGIFGGEIESIFRHMVETAGLWVGV